MPGTGMPTAYAKIKDDLKKVDSLENKDDLKFEDE